MLPKMNKNYIENILRVSLWPLPQSIQHPPTSPSAGAHMHMFRLLCYASSEEPHLPCQQHCIPTATPPSHHHAKGDLWASSFILLSHAAIPYADTFLYTNPIILDPQFTLFPLQRCRLNQTCSSASSVLSFLAQSGNKEITVLSWQRTDFLLSKHWCFGREIKL